MKARPLTSPVVFVMLVAGTAAFALTAAAAARPDLGPTPDIPLWKRELSGEAASRVYELTQRITQLEKKNKFSVAVEPAREVAAIQTLLLGFDHWQTVDARRAVDDLRALAAMPVEGRKAVAAARDLDQKAEVEHRRARHAEAERIIRNVLEVRRKWLGDDHPDTARTYNDLASNLRMQRKDAEAEFLNRQALTIRLKTLGENHPDTAQTYNNLAANLSAQRKYAEAEPLCRKALAIAQKTLGENHVSTAISSNGVAANLQSQAKYAEAEPFYRNALAIAQKTLGENHRNTATSYKGVAANLQSQAKYAEAEPFYRKALAIRLKTLGENQPDTTRSYIDIAYNLQSQGKYAESERLCRKILAIRLKTLGENQPDTATSYNDVGYNLQSQRKYAEAEPFYRKALAIYLKTLGENQPNTAGSYNNLAHNLEAQAKYSEAEPPFRKALAIRQKTLGENHPATAQSYNDVGANLSSQGKYAEAEPFCRKALAIRLETLGEEHPTTAVSYGEIASNLNALGRYAEAEPLYRKALAIRLKTRGESHPATAISYSEVASNLSAQGKHAEAESLNRKALAIRLQTLGENHPNTAQSYDRVASNLNAQRKFAEAEPLFRKSLAICIKTFGENNFRTAHCYNNFASNLNEQGKYTEAEPLCRQALAIALKTLGENHPNTAKGYTNVAFNLFGQRKYAEAESPSRKALAIRLKTLGQNHPETVVGYNFLGADLNEQGKTAEAVANWTLGADILERTRTAQSSSGLERSLTAIRTQLPALAIALARQGQFRDAWFRWETDLARGLLDDVSARLLRPLTADQDRREADLAGQLQRFDERINRLAANDRRTQDQDRQLDALHDQQGALRGQWVEFQNALDRHYQAYAGKPSNLEEIQKALPKDAALVGWLDAYRRHWACLVRRDGAPVWVATPASGPEGLCTPQDHERDRDCQIALATRTPGWRDLTAAVAQQRLGPLLPHLSGVRHLIVLPSPTLAAVPLEALVAALPEGSPHPVVSYAPSGSMFARLSAPQSQRSGSPRLLALGDPAFPKPVPNGPAPAPPDHGIPIVAVTPHGIADLFDIKPGDVLLEYNGKVLRTIKDLAIVPVGNKQLRVPVKFWRDGEVRSLEIPPGPLAIKSDADRPVAQVVLSQRAAAEVLRSGSRAAGFAPLPGTRREVQAIAALFPKDQVTTLLGQDATESNLQQLAQTGALETYRFLHLATHGEANRNVALSSAIFLAAEPDRPAASVDTATPESVPDGQITAEQIVRTWDLDADLVVLSACESGLGRLAGGEGYLGFAQALFVKGAKSLILSQWKVDDKATALLMTRFYQKMLGKRAGLSQPLPKATALDEAKHWLQNLTDDEVGPELAALERGTVRPLAPVDGPAPRAASSAPKPAGVRPYAHPFYWASFILIGDPH